MNRRSVHFVRAAQWHHTELPLKGYFIWVGTALLVLLFAANWLLPTPAPNLLISSRVTLPPIRVYSKTKAPDEVAADNVSPAIVAARAENATPADGPLSPDPHPGETVLLQSPPRSSPAATHRRTASVPRALNTRAAFAQFIPRQPKPTPATQPSTPKPKEGKS